MSYIVYQGMDQVLTLEGVVTKKGRHTTEKDLGIISRAAAVINMETERFEWLGEEKDLPERFRHEESVDETGHVWLPELVECHTHLVFAGERFHDYGLRCAGKTYQEVAAEGGGILHTLKHTREASQEDLVALGLKRLDAFQRFGVGAIEIKTGYGLSWDSEFNCLEAIAAMQEQTFISLIPTFLPAHATPPEFLGRTDAYVETICRDWIPEVGERKLAAFVDIFVEKDYFTAAHARRIAEAGAIHGMKLKLHSDQFTDQGGTALGLELGATSIDHLDFISDENIARFGKSDTVAVLLPGASIFTRTPYPPARKLIDAGARVALSTDFNPGTCPSRNLPLMTTLACSQMQMTLPESIAAITYNAAAALGIESDFGHLRVGNPFRIFRLKSRSYEILPYSFGELDWK